MGVWKSASNFVSRAQALDPGFAGGLQKLSVPSHPGLIPVLKLCGPFLQARPLPPPPVCWHASIPAVLGRPRSSSLWCLVALGRVSDRREVWGMDLLLTQELGGAKLGRLPGRGGHRVGWHRWREPELCGSVTLVSGDPFSADSHTSLALLS